MIYQNNKQLYSPIQKSGCLFLSLLFIGQVEAHKVLDVKEINDIYCLSLKKNWIDTEMTVKKPDEIIAQVTGREILYQIGSKDGDNPIIFWRWVKDKNYNWTILRYKTTGNFGTHFVVGDKYSKEFWDPLLGKGYNSLGINRIDYYKV